MNRCQNISNKIVLVDIREINNGLLKHGNIRVLQVEQKHTTNIVGTS